MDSETNLYSEINLGSEMTGLARVAMSAFRCWIDVLPDVNAMISDVSDAGAVVTLDSAAKLPKTFVVYLTKSGSVGRKAEVTWREGVTIGVRFTGKATRPDDPFFV
jgi:hypothetical protein